MGRCCCHNQSNVVDFKKILPNEMFISPLQYLDFGDRVLVLWMIGGSLNINLIEMDLRFF
jgi:hypothetical protein